MAIEVNKYFMEKSKNQLFSFHLILLTSAHLLNDFYAGFLIPLLSHFQTVLHLTIAQVSVLPMVLAVFGSILQPLFGIGGDRFNKKIFVVSGVLCSALFMSTICFSPNFITLIFMLIIGASGVASFHPNGAASVAILSNYNSTFLMSLFLMAGCVGLGVAPFIIASIVSIWGIDTLWVASFPGILLAILLFKRLPVVSPQENRVSLSSLKVLVDRASWPVWLMIFIMFLRSIVITSFMCFLSILLTERGDSFQKSGVAISVFLMSGTIGGLLGGYISDYINRRIVICASSILACPLLLFFLGSWEYSIIFLSFSGITIFSASAVNVLTVQELCPGMASAVSGIAMGFVWGTAGLTLPIIGKLADLYSMQTALEIVVYLAPIAGILALLLPNIDKAKK